MSPNIAPKVLRILPSADSYLAAVFDTTEHRDNALAALKWVYFKVDGKVVPLTVRPFRDTTAGKVLAWSITGGYGDTCETVAEAVQARFKEVDPQGNYTSTFEVRRVLQTGVSNGQFLVKFASPPPWGGRQIQVGSEIRLVTAEWSAHCRFCSSRGHSMYDCRESTDWGLDSDAVHGIISNNNNNTSSKGQDVDMGDPTPGGMRDPGESKKSAKKRKREESLGTSRKRRRG
ncbi:hypothetical protein VTN02DRAFT_3067 [Thermoascus thermophilus]